MRLETHAELGCDPHRIRMSGGAVGSRDASGPNAIWRQTSAGELGSQQHLAHRTSKDIAVAHDKDAWDRRERPQGNGTIDPPEMAAEVDATLRGRHLAPVSHK